MTRREAIREIAKVAVECERAHGFPAEVLFAQCALESDWLQKAPGNNPFGIKFVPGRHADKQLLRTREWFSQDELTKWLTGIPGREVIAKESGPDSRGKTLYRVRDWFAKYQTLLDACSDYIRLLTRGRYKAAWEAYRKDGDYEALLRGIAKAGYSTASSYADHALKVLTDEVRSAIDDARGV